MKDIDFLHQYTDAAKESSTRTRQILLVMIIASILTFVALWNTRAGGWLTWRLHQAKATVDILRNEKAQEEAASTPFNADDFINAPKLCGDLKNKDSLLAGYMRSRFTPDTLRSLDRYNPKLHPPRDLLTALAGEFNRLLKSHSLFERDRFAQVRLRDKTEALRKNIESLQGREPRTLDIMRLNRMLLEDAFPDSISRVNEVMVIPADEQELYLRAMEFTQRPPRRTLLQAEQALVWLQKIRAEQVGQVQVPVLGISFDVNDLGILGGFAFIVLLTWVNYSLWHHSNNLKLAFDFARELDTKGGQRLLYYTYQNLAMRQVLTIPPRPASARGVETIQPTTSPDVPRQGHPARSSISFTDKLIDFVQKGSKLLYALPLFVQLIIVLHDWDTSKTGWEVNPDATRSVLWAGTFFLGVIVILTGLCFYMWSKTYDTWRLVADEI